MKFQINEKKVTLPQAVHAYAEKKVAKLDRYFRDDAEAFVAFSVEKNRNKVELTVHAAKNVEQEKTDKAGKIIRQERYTGAMERSFYVGEALTEEDIGAKFENGVLTLNVPKKDVKKLPEKKVIQIEG